MRETLLSVALETNIPMRFYKSAYFIRDVPLEPYYSNIETGLTKLSYNYTLSDSTDNAVLPIYYKYGWEHTCPLSDYEENDQINIMKGSSIIGHILYNKFTHLKKENTMKTTMNTSNNVATGVLAIITQKKNQLETMALDYGTERIKRHFGKELLFQINDNGSIIGDIVTKFIKKYDPRFESHIQKGNGDKPVLLNAQFIVKFDAQTYMYVATGNKIGNTEERFLMSANISSQDLYMYIFGKHMTKYVNEVEKLTHDIYCSNELGLFTIDSSSGRRGDDDDSVSLDVTYNNLATRSLDTLYFSTGEKDKICAHINRFNDNESFYTEKQLLYKTGILLYGEPGTGKSSLVKALASTYNRSIVNVNVSNVQRIDLNKLTQSINVDENRRYIILLEDVDTLFLNRDENSHEKADKEDQAIVNKLLQFLDSNTSPTNVIFIATTNHKERLDDALLREGRFDLKVEVNPLNAEESYLFGESFGLSREVMKSVLEDLDNDFPARKGRYNQSSLQARILSKIENKSKEKAKELYGEMIDTNTKEVK